MSCGSGDDAVGAAASFTHAQPSGRARRDARRSLVDITFRCAASTLPGVTETAVPSSSTTGERGARSATMTTGFAALFDAHRRQRRHRRARQARLDRVRADGVARRRPPADRGRPGRRQDQPRQGARGIDRLHVEARPVHPRPAADRPRRRQRLRTLDREVPVPARARCSPTSCSPTRSTGPRRRRSRRCSRRWRSARSPSTAPTRALPPPFMVIATQNPVEQEGTYRLPESQLDRFLLRISLGYPGRTAEMAILDGQGAAEALRDAPAGRVDRRGAWRWSRRSARSTSRARSSRTWSTSPRPAAAIRPIELGLSPRATLQLSAAARAHAAAQRPRLRHARRRQGGRRAGAGTPPVLRAGSNARMSAEDAIGELLADVPVPVAR